MAGRTVTYVFRGDVSQLIAAMEAAGAAADRLDHRLDSVNATSVQTVGSTKDLGKAYGDLPSGMRAATRESQGLERSLGRTERAVARVGQAARGNKSDLNSFAGRLKVIGTAAALLGPALIPMGANLVPTISGLVAGLGSLVGGAGATMLAFKGMGEAMDAFRKYQADPSAETFAAMREQMDKVGPAAESLIRYVDSLTPQFQALQRVAREGMFPGMQDGLEELMTTMPQVGRIVEGLSTAMGDLSRSAGENIAGSSDWQDFFSYLEREAGPTLDTFGRSLGNFTTGFLSMIEAFDPVTQDFLRGMADTSGRFRTWARDLNETQGFRDFVGYLRESAPMVGDFFSSLGSAIGNFIQAAAPIADVTIPALTGLLDAFSGFIGSDIGKTLTSVAAGMLAVSSASKLMGKAMGAAGLGGAAAALGGGSKGLPMMFGNITSGANQARSSISRYGKMIAAASVQHKDLTKTGSVLMSALSGNTAVGRKLGSTFARVGGAALKAGGAAAIMGLAVSGLDDKLGVSNATMGAMIGMMGGPWGAAIGGAIGFIKDFADAGDGFNDSITSMQQSMKTNTLDWNTYSDQAKKIQEEYEKARGGLSGTAKAMATDIKNSLTGSDAPKYQQELADKNREAQQSFKDLRDNVVDVADQIGAVDFEPGNAEHMTEMLQRMSPAMDALGMSVEDLGSASASEMAALVNTMRELSTTPSGPLMALGDAVSALGDDSLSAGEKAQGLQSALQALMAPQQGLIAAQDQLTMSMRHLKDNLATGSRALKGNSDAAIQNRAAISKQVTGIQQLLTAQANANVPAQKIAQTFAQQRTALLNQAQAAGLSRKATADLINTMGLTPEAISITMQASGFSEAESTATKVKLTLDTMPKDIRMAVKAQGLPETQADLNRLEQTIGRDLTGKERKVLLSAQDEVTPAVAKVLGQLGVLSAKQVRAIIDADDKATPKANKAKGTIEKLGGTIGKALLDADDQASPKAQKAKGLFDAFGGNVGRGLLDATDNATPKAEKAKASLDKVGGTNAQATISLVGQAAAFTMAAAMEAKLNQLNGKKANATATLKDDLTPKANKAANALNKVKGKNAKATATLNDQLTPKANKAANALNKVKGKKANATASLKDQLTPKANKAANALNKIKGKKASATATLKDNATPKANKVVSALKRVGNQNAKPTATLQDRASAKIAQVRSKLAALNGASANPSVNVNGGQALATIGAIRAGIASIQSKTVSVTVVKRQVGGGGNADGGIHVGGVQTYASGGFGGSDRANRHWPELAKATNRVWAEPETKGEAYIPLANDYRRPRAKEILEITAGQFGGSVQWYAQGAADAARRTQTRRTQPQPASQRRHKASRRRSDGVSMTGQVRIANWADGTGFFEGIAQDVVDANDLLVVENDRADW